LNYLLLLKNYCYILFFDFVRIFFHHASLYGFCGETKNGARLARMPGIQGSALNPEERRNEWQGLTRSTRCMCVRHAAR